MPPPSTVILPPSLSHLVLFSPSIRPPTPHDADSEDNGSGERDRDHEDDLREAAQILFYTSREAAGVSRDKMLRQVGLAKGLMGFADMLAPGDMDEPRFWSIHSQRTRMIVYSPEPEFFIYINITLAHALPAAGPNSGKGEPISTSQGLSDRLVVDGLKRGYEDFRLLHGPFSHLMPPSPSLSSLLDKYWTRFAFSLESTLLTPAPSSDILQAWLSGFPRPQTLFRDATARALEAWAEDTDLPSRCVYGIFDTRGPVSIRGELEEAAKRYLHHLLQAALPPPAEIVQVKDDGRSTLGFGMRSKKEGRKSNWALGGLGNAVNWVPGLGSRPATPTAATRPTEEAMEETPTGTETPTTTSRSRWPSLGLGGLGEAMGSMGTALGLARPTEEGAPPSQEAEGDKQDLPVVTVTSEDSGQDPKEDGSSNIDPAAQPSGPDAQAAAVPHENVETEQANEVQSVTEEHSVLQSPVVLPDLAAAVESEPEVEIGWVGRPIWLGSGERCTERRLTWVIRDNILLFFILPSHDPYPMPSARTTVALYSKLSALLMPDTQDLSSTQASSSLSRATTSTLGANSVIFQPRRGEIQLCGPPMDPASGVTMMELKDSLMSDPGTVEIFERTSAGRFVVAKRTRPAPPFHSCTSSEDETTGGRKGEERGEMFMLVGKKDASLTDAEHALRGLARLHPDMAA